MSDVEDGRLEFLVEALELGPHLDTQFRVQVGERLVHQEGLWVAHQGAAEGNALRPTAGELLRAAFEQMAKLEEFGGLVDASLDSSPL